MISILAQFSYIHSVVFQIKIWFGSISSEINSFEISSIYTKLFFNTTTSPIPTLVLTLYEFCIYLHSYLSTAISHNHRLTQSFKSSFLLKRLSTRKLFKFCKKRKRKWQSDSFNASIICNEVAGTFLSFSGMRDRRNHNRNRIQFVYWIHTPIVWSMIHL